MCTVTIEIPDEVLARGQQTAAAFGRELRIAAAIQMFASGAVSQGRAAELSGLTRAEFLEALSRNKVSIWQFTREEIQADLRNVE